MRLEIKIFTQKFLDLEGALKLTNKIIVESKRQLIKIVNPELAPSKKRKMKSKSNDDDPEAEFVQKLIEDFEHEE